MGAHLFVVLEALPNRHVQGEYRHVQQFIREPWRFPNKYPPKNPKRAGAAPSLELHFIVGAHFLLVHLFVILEASPNRHVPSYYRRPTVCTRHVRESLRFSKIHLKSPKIRGLTQPGVAFRSGRAFPPRPSLRHTRSRSPRRTGTPVAHLPPLLRPPRHPAQEITH